MKRIAILFILPCSAWTISRDSRPCPLLWDRPEKRSHCHTRNRPGFSRAIAAKPITNATTGQ